MNDVVHGHCDSRFSKVADALAEEITNETQNESIPCKRNAVIEFGRMAGAEVDGTAEVQRLVIARELDRRAETL